MRSPTAWRVSRFYNNFFCLFPQLFHLSKAACVLWFCILEIVLHLPRGLQTFLLAPKKSALAALTTGGTYIHSLGIAFIDKNTVNEVGELVRHAPKLFGDLKSTNLHEKAKLEQRLSRCCWRTNKFEEYVNGS